MKKLLLLNILICSATLFITVIAYNGCGENKKNYRKLLVKDSTLTKLIKQDIDEGVINLDTSLFKLTMSSDSFFIFNLFSSRPHPEPIADFIASRENYETTETAFASKIKHVNLTIEDIVEYGSKAQSEANNSIPRKTITGFRLILIKYKSAPIIPAINPLTTTDSYKNKITIALVALADNKEFITTTLLPRNLGTICPTDCN